MCSTTERAVRELPPGPLAPSEARRFLHESGCSVHATALLESADDEGGRGLQLLELLSDDWGVEREADGKTVWFRLRQPAASA